MKYLSCLVPVAALFVGGCTTTPPVAEVDAKGKPIEYVYYTPVGSHIPVKIRKDQLEPADQQTAPIKRSYASSCRRAGSSRAVINRDGRRLSVPSL